MTPEQIDRVFGRGRLKMVTGEHVEVYREAVGPGERRRYTKRFLNTPDGDFGHWTEREWRILARLIGHGITCVPDVVQIDRGRVDGAQLVQTYDAGVTVDQWATLLPVTRDDRVYGHVFEDCAHWWALAHHCLLALNVIHPLELVHLDIKGDNVCIPYSPVSFDPHSSDLHLQPQFGQLALIDFAFALISRASLTTPLPIGWQKDYDYQSPRLLAALEAGRNGDLQATRELDWRCDFYSLAAMLKRYLPDEGGVARPPLEAGWTTERYDAAKALILRIRELHDGELPRERPHPELIDLTAARLFDDDLARSLDQGWTLAREASVASAPASPLTPVTLLAPSIRVVRSGRTTAVTVLAPADDREVVARTLAVPVAGADSPQRKRHERAAAALLATAALAAVGAALWYSGDRPSDVDDRPGVAEERSQATVAEPADTPAEAAEQNAPEAETDTSQPPASGTRAEAPAVQPPRSQPSPQPSAQVATSPVVSNAEAPPSSVPSSDALPRDKSIASHAQPRNVESRASMLDAHKAQPTMSSKQALAAQRFAEKATRAQAAAEKRAALSHASVPKEWKESKEAKEPKEPKEAKERVYAPWASLEPPAWALSTYRGKGPGVPAGVMPYETRTNVATVSGAASASPASASAVARLDSGSANSQNAPAVVANSTPQPASTPTTSNVQRESPPLAQASPPTTSSAPAQASPPTMASAPAQSSPPTMASAPPQASPTTQEDYAALGRQTLQTAVPRIAARAEQQVARVLAMAASAYTLLEERAVAEASRGARVAEVDLLPLQRQTSAAEARRSNDEARTALRLHHDVREAIELQLRAFGANPRDPEITGNLASLYLKTSPAQPEMARQLALVALTARGPQYHSARMEDWNTFAIASALTGREADARNALYVTLTLTADVDARCVATLNAVATFGERMRKPVEAMFYRLHAQGRAIGSQPCAWPPNSSLVSRLQ
jgi:hypothetical protein